MTFLDFFFEGALKFYHRAQSLDRGSEVIAMNRSAALLAMGHFSEAYAQAQKVVDGAAFREKALFRLVSKEMFGFVFW